MAGLSPDRRARHDLVAAALAAGDDAGLVALLRAAPRGAVGVGGGSSVVDVRARFAVRERRRPARVPEPVAGTLASTAGAAVPAVTGCGAGSPS